MSLVLTTYWKNTEKYKRQIMSNINQYVMSQSDIWYHYFMSCRPFEALLILTGQTITIDYTKVIYLWTHIALVIILQHKWTDACINLFNYNGYDAIRNCVCIVMFPQNIPLMALQWQSLSPLIYWGIYRVLFISMYFSHWLVSNSYMYGMIVMKYFRTV